jgi:hypothetical protein
MTKNLLALKLRTLLQEIADHPRTPKELADEARQLLKEMDQGEEE